MASILEIVLQGEISPDTVIAWLQKSLTDVPEKLTALEHIQQEFVPFFLNYLRDHTLHLLQNSKSATPSPAKTPSIKKLVKPSNRGKNESRKRQQLFGASPAGDIDEIKNLPSSVFTPDTSIDSPGYVSYNKSERHNHRQGSRSDYASQKFSPRCGSQNSSYAQTPDHQRSKQKFSLGEFFCTPDQGGHGYKKRSPHSSGRRDYFAETSPSPGMSRRSGGRKKQNTSPLVQAKSARCEEEPAPVFCLASNSDFPSMSQDRRSFDRVFSTCDTKTSRVINFSSLDSERTASDASSKSAEMKLKGSHRKLSPAPINQTSTPKPRHNNSGTSVPRQSSSGKSGPRRITPTFVKGESSQPQNAAFLVPIEESSDKKTCEVLPKTEKLGGPQEQKDLFVSPASDLAARRGVFSRRHYGSVELLNSSDSEGSPMNAGRFRVETGERDGEEVSSPLNSPIHLENPEFQTRWYFKYFLGKLHQNYVGIDPDKEPFLLSVVVTDANNHNMPQYRAILWTKTGAKKICLPYNPSKPQTVKGILSHLDLDRLDKGPKEIFNPEIQKEILVLEEQEGSVNFKIGVLYGKEGQSSDDEFFSNEKGSSAFNKFLTLLGDRIKLKGWDKFKAGLDVKTNTTGEESIYTVYEGHEIMFHVSTLLPYSHDNKQQVERKRHIGNDIVNIVFWDGDPSTAPSFKPSMMKTRFTHKCIRKFRILTSSASNNYLTLLTNLSIERNSEEPEQSDLGPHDIFALITYNKETLTYRLNVFSEESVPLFGPPLPSPPEFHNLQEFRDFLLVKLINGEKAAVNNPVFAQKRERTLEMLLKTLYLDYLPENNMLNRRAFSDVIQDTTTSTRKEDARRAEFVRIGQTLKVKTILRGDAPTSLVTTGILKREPWEPQLCYSDFNHQIITGDSWGDKVMITTDQGTMLIEDGIVPRLIFDKSVAVKQISVIEPHGLLIMRTDKGKDGKVHVFRLIDFEGEANESIIRTKVECRDHKLEKTKGCNIYAISKPGTSLLRMVVAVGRKLLVFNWKHSAEWLAWCSPTFEQESVDGFTLVRELDCYDTPQLLSLIDGTRGEADSIRADNQICVGYKNQFDLINEKNGDTLQLFQVDTCKNLKLVSAMDIYEDEEAELLLSYNHVSHFQKLKEETSFDFDIHWNSEPNAIVCAFPYVMAFTPDSIEIRLIVNGNLVHTMTMPDLTLISAKYDIFFSSSALPPPSPKDRTSMVDTEFSSSPPPSPSCKVAQSPSSKANFLTSKNIYKIPISCLTGHMAPEKTVSSHLPNNPSLLLAPVMSVSSTSPSLLRRSPLLRTKCLQPVTPDKEMEPERHDSSSSDSGITIMRQSECSPPESPSVSGAVFVETEII